MFRLVFNAELTIGNKTVMMLYPHMFHSREFMTKAIGHVLHCQVSQTFRFGSHNQIEAITTEYNLPQAWLHFLKNPQLVKELLMHERRERCYITISTGEARQIAQEF